MELLEFPHFLPYEELQVLLELLVHLEFLELELQVFLDVEQLVLPELLELLAHLEFLELELELQVLLDVEQPVVLELVHLVSKLQEYLHLG